jgi:diguanylate cyclase (GGDEF)-like protein
VALVLVPIIVRGSVLGSMSVAVSSKPARLRESRELHDRLSGIAAQAAVGLENGELIDRMSYDARHDALTGLANRSFFSEQFATTLELARESDTPVGLFYLDLDDFKLVNDKYGHATGDELLCQVAARLLTTLRAHDTVARLGGDEFAIIFHDAASAARVEAARLRVASAFDEPFRIAGCDIAVRASIGRAIWPYDAEELNRLLRHADTSMYSAKRAAMARPDSH